MNVLGTIEASLGVTPFLRAEHLLEGRGQWPEVPSACSPGVEPVPHYQGPELSVLPPRMEPPLHECGPGSRREL